MTDLAVDYFMEILVKGKELRKESRVQHGYDPYGDKQNTSKRLRAVLKQLLINYEQEKLKED